MKTQTLTVSEYARLLDKTPQHVSSQLRAEKELPGVVSCRKIEGRTGSWLIDVLCSWVTDTENDKKVIDALSALEFEETMTKATLSKETGIPVDSIQWVLDRLRLRNLVELVPTFSEWTLKATGSGYWLKSKNNP